MGRVNIDALRRDRDQLWAEACERFHAGENWWLDSQVLVEAAAEEQQARYEGDAWDDEVAEYISTRNSVSIVEILGVCLEKPKKDWSRSDEMRVARVLKSKGWIRSREPEDEHGYRPWRYRRGPNLQQVSQASS